MIENNDLEKIKETVGIRPTDPREIPSGPLPVPKEKGKKTRTVQKYTKYAVELAEQMSKEDWQRIKHFGKIEMAMYIQGVYQQGFKAGVESVKPKVSKTPIEKPAEDQEPAPDPGGEPDELGD